MKISQVVFASSVALMVGVSASLAQAEEKRNEGLPLFLWLSGQSTGEAAKAEADATTKPAAVVAAAGAEKPAVAPKRRKKNMKTWKSGPKVNTGRKLTSTTAAPVAPAPTAESQPVVAVATTPPAPTAKKLPPLKKVATTAKKSDAVRGGLAPRNYTFSDLLGLDSPEEPKTVQSAAAPSHAPQSQAAPASAVATSATSSPAPAPAAPALASPALTEDATVIASVVPLIATQPLAPQKPKARVRKDMKTWKSHAKKVAIKKPAGPPGIDPKFARKEVSYETKHPVGSIVVDTSSRYLYHVKADGKAMRYGIGVGRLGFTWKGTAKIKRKAEWPAWHPPASMRKREPWLPVRMEGGPENPLGARALYLFQGGKDTLYRIHGTNNPASIGQALSSGCVRLLNSDVEHLYTKVKMGSKVVVL